MATTLADKIQRPSLKHFPGDSLIDAITNRVGIAPEPLAAPPPGSDLKPVMGERGLPVLGKTVKILREGQQLTVEYYPKYGGVMWTGAFGTEVVWVISPDAIQQVLANKDKVYSQSGWEYFIANFFTRGLMLLDGQEHLLHRRIMQEAFTRSRLEAYLSQINGIVEDAVPAWPVDEPMLMFPAVKSLSLDIATRVFMGCGPSPESDRLTQAFIDTVRAGTGFVRAGHPRAAESVEQGTGRSQGARGLLPASSCAKAGIARRGSVRRSYPCGDRRRAPVR